MPRLTINYANTVIYKIVSNDLNITDCYVGHTTDFTSRKKHHKYKCTDEMGGSYNFKVYRIIRDNGGWDNWSMIEIEKFPCQDSNEAIAKEREWFERLNSNLNSQYPHRSDEEYREHNKVNIAIRRKEYYKNNREARLLYRKQHYEKNREKNIAEYKIYNKIYNEQNKDRIKAWMKARNSKEFLCDCGRTICVGAKGTHLKSQVHMKYLECLQPL